MNGILVVTDSLAETLDAVNDAFFWGTPVDAQTREQTAVWIAGRQGAPGSYSGLCAPTPTDLKTGARLFTGEPVTTRAATAHILGEEASRALTLLAVDRPDVCAAQAAASAGMLSRIQTAEERGQIGTYCCGKCTPAYWRNLTAGNLGNAEARLTAGLRHLKTQRDGKGRWRRFPLYYTVLALVEIDLPEAVEELHYVAPALERTRPAGQDRYTIRRQALAERALAKL
jgi:hypothetical protein